MYLSSCLPSKANWPFLISYVFNNRLFLERAITHHQRVINFKLRKKATMATPKPQIVSLSDKAPFIIVGNLEFAVKRNVISRLFAKL